VLDDAALLVAAVVTLRMSRLHEQAGRIPKLISGVVISLLGLALTVRPEWLEWT
jgi:hypothetical protein